MAKGAVAAADAEQAEVVAQGEAKALICTAQAKAPDVKFSWGYFYYEGKK